MNTLLSRFYAGSRLEDLRRWTEALPDTTEWFWVTLDSRPTRLGEPQKLLRSLREHGVSARWNLEGLWLAQSELQKPVVQSQIFVPFSACYIFVKSVPPKSRPAFELTTDLGEPFVSDQLALISESIALSGALAFASDGCGLACVSLDPQFTEMCDQQYTHEAGGGG